MGRGERWMRLGIAAAAALATACGGDGGSDGPPAIAGTWTVDLGQSSALFCSEGTVIAACSGGCYTRSETVEIAGGDRFGELVTVVFDDCTYGATRKSVDFIPLEPMYGDAAPPETCVRSLELSEIRNGAARLTVSPNAAEPGPNGEVTCVAQESGEMRRGG